jgi:hypothetical protein
MKTKISLAVNEFKSKINPVQRYVSFDYCYNYFRKGRLTNDMEKSCLTLGFYLASWGMLRGSSFLLNKSVKHFEPTIKYLATLDKSIWKIDINKYNEKNIETILQIYSELKKNINIENTAHRTLVTKVMLGVFGFIPAYDQFFIKTFSKIFKGECSFASVSKKSLYCLKRFYDENNKAIDKIASKTFTINFKTGERTRINYPKAKIIDMYGFVVGQK